MFRGLAGLTAIEVSLCGPTDCSAQSVLTLAAVELEVAQMAVPVFTDGAVPNTAPGIGAGEFTALCVKSIGCGLSSPATGIVCPSASAAIGSRIVKRTRLKAPASSPHHGGPNTELGPERGRRNCDTRDLKAPSPDWAVSVPRAFA